jgi:hypothetical protein
MSMSLHRPRTRRPVDGRWRLYKEERGLKEVDFLGAPKLLPRPARLLDFLRHEASGAAVPVAPGVVALDCASDAVGDLGRLLMPSSSSSDRRSFRSDESESECD